jgi:hypothetical protein
MGVFARLFGGGAEPAGSTSKASSDLVQLVFPFKMSQGAFTEIDKGYRDSIGKYSARTAKDFFPLACMIEDNKSVYVPLKPYLHRPLKKAEAFAIQPMGDAQVLFTIVVPGQSYQYKDEGRSTIMRMDKVIDAFQSGNFLLPHAVQLPLAKLRIAPFTPSGIWY